MASTRAVSSALRSAAAIRPAVSTHRCAAASLLSASRAFTTAVPTRVSAASPPAARRASPSSPAARWYSADPSPTKLWSFDEIQKQLQTNEDKNVIFVDVREPVELRETGKIPGAINIPMTTAVQSLHVPEDEFEDMHGYARPGKDKTLVFYCKAGIRAKSAAGLALHAGWTSVGEYRGSWLDWAEHNGPVEKVGGGK